MGEGREEVCSPDKLLEFDLGIHYGKMKST